MKILVEHNGGLGDVILDTAYLKKLKEEDPTGQLDIITYEGTAEIFRGANYLDTVIPVPKDYCTTKMNEKLYNKYDRHIYVLGMLSWAFFTKKTKTLFEQRKEFYHVNALPEDIEINLIDTFPNDIFKDIKTPVVFSAPNGKDIKTGKHISKKMWKTLFDTYKEITFIQIGSKEYDFIFDEQDNVICLLDTLRIQQSLSAICLSKFVIGCDNFLNHASKAFNKKGIFLWGANDPKQYGWDHNINLYNKVKCSPCLTANPDHDCCFKNGIDNIPLEWIDDAIKKLI